MSGRKQHHIPQSLLKRFAIPGKRKERVHVFTREKSYVSSIKDVAAERDFYSDPASIGTQTLDGIITRYENTLADRLAQLYHLPFGCAADAPLAAEMVAHLTVRNAHLRGSLTGGLQATIAQAVDVFCDETNLRILFGVDAREFPPQIAAIVEEHFAGDRRFTDTGLPRALLHKVAFAAMRENFTRFVTSNLPHFQLVLQYLAVDAPKQVAESHRAALSAGLAPDARTTALATLHWKVLEASVNNIVLPDCVALGTEREIAAQPLILADLSRLSRVLMPLAPDRVLVGSRDPDAPSVNLASFNAEAVACSHAIFVSSREGPDLTRLAATIGERSRETVDQAVASAFEGFRRERELPAEAAAEVTGAPVGEGPLSREAVPAPALHSQAYQVSFLGVRNTETAHSIAGALDAIVRGLRPMMPLDRLDGFTFAQDYEAALENIDRGFQSPSGKKLSLWSRL